MKTLQSFVQPNQINQVEPKISEKMLILQIVLVIGSNVEIYVSPT